MTKGKILGLSLGIFTLIFAIILWWAQTRAYYRPMPPINSVRVGDRDFDIADFTGIENRVNPLGLRACFRWVAPQTVLQSGAPTIKAPLRSSPRWFPCFNPLMIEQAVASGQATALLAQTKDQRAFDLIVIIMQDGRGFMWRQLPKQEL